MLLSIIIPMYNAERFITGCLTSLYNQNIMEEDFEVIVINDGSHDSSEDLVREFQKNRSNIKLITQKNQGQSVARNRGIKEATGRYLCFVDADDFWIPGSFEKVYSFLLQLKQEYMDPLPDMITFGIEGGEKEYSDFNKIEESLKKEILKTYTDGKSYIARNNYNNGPWWYCLSREFIDRSQLSFMVGKLCEDGMFTMNTLLNAGTIIQVMGGVYTIMQKDPVVLHLL